MRNTKIDNLKELQQRIEMTVELDTMMYCYIIDTLRSFDANRTHTAEALGMNHRTLRHKLAQAKGLGYDVPPAKLGVPKKGNRGV